MREYLVQEEPWSEALWAEMRPLAEAHFAEVDGGVEANRPFRLDLRLMAHLRDAGGLLVVTARERGSPVGYFTWQISLDVESEGLLVGYQGAWFVAPGHPRIAVALFDESLRRLRARGVQHVFPHHRTQGRGANLGRFFLRRGAKHIQQTYSLWIGGQ